MEFFSSQCFRVSVCSICVTKSKAVEIMCQGVSRGGGISHIKCTSAVKLKLQNDAFTDNSQAHTHHTRIYTRTHRISNNGSFHPKSTTTATPHQPINPISRSVTPGAVSNITISGAADAAHIVLPSWWRSLRTAKAKPPPSIRRG